MKLAVNVGPEFGRRVVERRVTQIKCHPRRGMAHSAVVSGGQCRCRLPVDTAWQQDQDQPNAAFAEGTQGPRHFRVVTAAKNGTPSFTCWSSEPDSWMRASVGR